MGKQPRRHYISITKTPTLKQNTSEWPGCLLWYNCVTEEGKEKKVNIDLKLLKLINALLYLCDNKFHTEALIALLSDTSKSGFINR